LPENISCRKSGSCAEPVLANTQLLPDQAPTLRTGKATPLREVPFRARRIKLDSGTFYWFCLAHTGCFALATIQP